MNPALIIALIQQIILPEVLVAIRAHRNATGQDPTDAQILAALQIDATKGITIGQAWLAAHPPTP